MKTIFTSLGLAVLTGQLHAQVSFVLSSSPGVGNDAPYSVAAADVNGDGKIDLITANLGGNSLTVLTNNGSGGFALAGTYSVGDKPWSVAAADVNGDGKIDLISVNYWDNSLTVLTNNGSGGFVLAGTYPVGSYPQSVAAADVNGDGKIDLIAANEADNSLTVLTNDGSGGFVLAGTYSVGNRPYSVAAADVNGDGKIDLISANEYYNFSLTVLTNNGSGGFSVAGTYPVGSYPESVAAADVNGDGKIDLISANHKGNSLTVLTNDGSGGFVLAGTYPVGEFPSSVATADVNGDGKVDLISANTGDNSLTVLTNDGSGGFVLAGTYPVGSQPESVAAADVNGDGKIDLISANWGVGNSLTVLTNATSFPSSSLPILTSQALGQTNLFGSAVAFTVLANATGIEPARQISYQWQMAGTNLPGATNNSLSLTNLSFSQSGNYDVIVSNYVGSVTSSVAVLNVQFILVSINGQPAIGSGTAVASGQLSLSGGYAGGFLFYTLNGSTPTTESTRYTGPFTLTNSAVVTVLGMSADFSQNTLAPPVTVQIIPAYPLVISASGSGEVGLNPASGPYASNSVVTLTATAATNWVFSQWIGGITSSDNPYNLTVDGPLNVQAVFTPTAYPLTASTAGGGSVTVNGQVIAPATYYPTNSVVSITATASNGWSFLNWQGDASGTNIPLDVMMSTTNNIRAVFGTVVGTNVIGGGGVMLSLTNPLAYGTLLTASAVPTAGNYLVTWSSAASGTNSPTTILVTNATPTAGAVFATLPGGKYSLAVVVIGRGSVGISNQQSYYNPGSIVRLTASTTNAGTGFDGWSGDASGTSQTIVLTMNSNMVVQANFGKPLAVIPVPPLVTKQPTNLALVVSGAATFNVSASGTAPLNYQWQKNNVPLADNGFISGSTTSNLTLNAVSTTDAGSYSVVITNMAGSVTSSNASLVVNAQVYVAGTNVLSGSTVSVPIKLKALGQEISLQFSLSFNPNILTYQGVDNLSVIVTTNSPLPGQIGLTFQNFAGYSPGDQTLVNVVFAAQPVTSNTVSQINFADVPVGRQVIDGSFNVLSNVTYNGGSVTVVPAEYAADIYPRPTGDSTVDLRDWAEMGRFVTALDVVSNADEMLRADCAPRGNPDGVLTVADWVQAGRYAAKLDPLTVVSSGGIIPQVKPRAGFHPLASSSSLVQLVGSTATNGQTVTVPVNLVASGSENALGFNVAFDPTQLTLQGIAKGSAAGSTVMNVNTNQAATGRLEVTLALNSGNVFASGTNQIAKLSFKVLNQASGNLGVAFAATNPVVEQVCDISAGVLNASYTSAIISVQSGSKPTLQIQLTNGMVKLSWPQAFSNYTLQSIGTFGTNTWNTNLGSAAVVGTNLMITQPATNRVQFYRLSQ